MALVASDLPATISTAYDLLFQTEYNKTVAVAEEKFRPLVLEVNIGDNQGDKVNLSWLGGAPQLKPWLDEKEAQGLARYSWDLTVRRWEATIEVDLDFIKDSRWDQYMPRILEMSDNATRHMYTLISDLIINGETALCYDGQNFFDTDHSEGDSGTQSNELTGTGTTLAQLTVDYYTAVTALNGFKDDKGFPLFPADFRPLVWIPNNAALRQQFEALQNATLGGAGGSGNTNILANRFDLVVDPRLTDANDWYMFRPTGTVKPFIFINREPMHYEDNWGTGHPDVWSRRIGQSSVVGRDNATYGMWQGAVKVKNT